MTALSRLRIVGAVALAMVTAACANVADGVGNIGSPAAPSPSPSTLSTWQVWNGKSPTAGSSTSKAAKHSKSSSASPSASASSSPDAGASTSAAAPAAQGPSVQLVHVSLLESDGGGYGVGMPIVAFFDRAPTSAGAFERAVTVTVNGAPANGAWYWEPSSHSGAAVEAHYRPQQYWPAHAEITLKAPVKGLSAGSGLQYGNSVTLSMQTGAANIATVDGSTMHMTVTSDGTQVYDFPVMFGAATTPAYGGIKVVLEKDAVQRMVNPPGQPTYNLLVPWSVRLTYSGEFVHPGTWNGGTISGQTTAHGCTNLSESDAQSYFNFSRVGDVVTYRNMGNAQMPTRDGFGDWNVSWSTWQAGGLL